MDHVTYLSPQSAFAFAPRPKLKLSEIERLIRKHRIIVPCPARQTLIGMCEDGTFETAGDQPTSLGWLVYEDSFLTWVKRLDGTVDMAIAA